jgi:xanthine/CO dehydrogenase XdhC/CoxF family maturation factor
VRDGKVAAENVGDAAVVEAIVRESAARLSAEKSQLVSLDLPSGKLEVFFEVMPEPPKLIVVGAGHIAVPLVKIAKVLDFTIVSMTVCSSPIASASPTPIRFWWGTWRGCSRR